MSEAVTAADFKHGNDTSAAAANTQQVVATASAAPEPVTTTRGRVKSPLPEDQAGRAALVEEIVQPMVLRPLYTRSGRLIVPPPMKGSRDILVHQNTMADSEGLDRIQDDEDLDRMRAAHLLVPLADSRALQVNEAAAGKPPLCAPVDGAVCCGHGAGVLCAVPSAAGSELRRCERWSISCGYSR